MFKQDFSCPALLKDQNETLPIRGYHPLWLTFPGHSGCFQIGHWPGPRSLVTTNGVSVDVLSSSYLDISVRWVRLPCGINQNGLGFPIRKSADQSLLTAPRSLSQRVTSFIASLYQGIHQMLFKTLDRTVHESSTFFPGAHSAGCPSAHTRSPRASQNSNSDLVCLSVPASLGETSAWRLRGLLSSSPRRLCGIARFARRQWIEGVCPRYRM